MEHDRGTILDRTETVERQRSSPVETCNVQNGSGIVSDSKIMSVEVKCQGGGD
jgi:hypothetical protein